MKSIFLALIMVFSIQQTALPANISKAYSGFCENTQTAILKYAPHGEVFFTKASSPEKDLAILGGSIMQNIAAPALKPVWIPSIDSASLFNRENHAFPKTIPFLLEHPPQ